MKKKLFKIGLAVVTALILCVAAIAVTSNNNTVQSEAASNRSIEIRFLQIDTNTGFAAFIDFIVNQSDPIGQSFYVQDNANNNELSFNTHALRFMTGSAGDFEAVFGTHVSNGFFEQNLTSLTGNLWTNSALLGLNGHFLAYDNEDNLIGEFAQDFTTLRVYFRLTQYHRVDIRFTNSTANAAFFTFLHNAVTGTNSNIYVRTNLYEFFNTNSVRRVTSNYLIFSPVVTRSFMQRYNVRDGWQARSIWFVNPTDYTAWSGTVDVRLSENGVGSLVPVFENVHVRIQNTVSQRAQFNHLIDGLDDGHYISVVSGHFDGITLTDNNIVRRNDFELVFSARLERGTISNLNETDWRNGGEMRLLNSNTFELMEFVSTVRLATEESRGISTLHLILGIVGGVLVLVLLAFLIVKVKNRVQGKSKHKRFEHAWGQKY